MSVLFKQLLMLEKKVGVLVGAHVIPRPDQSVHDMIMRLASEFVLEEGYGKESLTKRGN
jgi:microcompartment protein CcmL/EutN